jgi:hypothetical protein
MFTFSKVFKLKNVQDKNCSNFKTFKLKCSYFKEKKTKKEKRNGRNQTFSKTKPGKT